MRAFQIISAILASLGILAGAGQRLEAQSRAAKSVPPPGIEISAADRTELERGLAALDSQLSQLSAAKDPRVSSLLPDVQIFRRAVATALANNEFFDAADVGKAKVLLAEGKIRADALLRGQANWTRDTGLVVRGYVSKIDGSVQPYGLVVPDSFREGGPHKFRLDVWLHGRNDKLSEIDFLDDRIKKPGDFTPADTIVLHPYGRFCNAFKFAGEVDVMEAIAAVKRQYRIDDDRIAIRGFSMGGAGCWHLAVHYADQWVAASPGAGFAESEEYLKMSDDAIAALPRWQRKLFHLYDCPDWAANLYHLPIVAYNGEDDPQKQAADVMEKALDKEGIALRRVIGPHTQHKWHPQAKETVDAAITSIADLGRDRTPLEVHFVTYTLRYNHMCWVQVDGLAEHWSEGSVTAAVSQADEQNVVAVDSKNVTDLTLSFPPGWSPMDVVKPVQVVIDDQELDAPRHDVGSIVDLPLVQSALWSGRRHGRRMENRRARFRGLAQTAWAAGADRRRVHGFVHHRAADWPIVEQGGRSVGANGNGSRHSPVATAIPRRCAGEGRHGDHRRRYRLGQFHSLGRCRKQRGHQANRRQAADSMAGR